MKTGKIIFIELNDLKIKPKNPNGTNKKILQMILMKKS